jgi:hypothetical protein
VIEGGEQVQGLLDLLPLAEPRQPGAGNAARSRVVPAPGVGECIGRHQKRGEETCLPITATGENAALLSTSKAEALWTMVNFLELPLALILTPSKVRRSK